MIFIFYTQANFFIKNYYPQVFLKG